MKKSLIVVGIITIVMLVTGIYFITKEKPEAELLPTQLIVTASTFTEPILDSIAVALTATLTTNDGAPVEGKIIEWSVSPKIYLGFPSLATNSSGQVSFNWYPTLASHAEPSENNTYTFIASFAGDSQYQGSTGSASVIFLPA